MRENFWFRLTPIDRSAATNMTSSAMTSTGAVTPSIMTPSARSRSGAYRLMIQIGVYQLLLGILMAFLHRKRRLGPALGVDVSLSAFELVIVTAALLAFKAAERGVGARRTATVAATVVAAVGATAVFFKAMGTPEGVVVVSKGLASIGLLSTSIGLLFIIVGSMLLVFLGEDEEVGEDCELGRC